MSIVIFGDLFNFPEGQAATNRVYTYAKGFLENGINVHVICFYTDYLDTSNGVINGINYYHAFRQKERSRYLLMRRWHKLLKYYRSLTLIRHINKKEKIVAINSWSNLLFTHVFAKFLAMVSGAKLISECSEHPFRSYQGSPLKKIAGYIKFFVETRIADGLLCISEFLVEFYERHGVARRKLFLVPSTVDPGRFIVNTQNPVDYDYIGYFGSLTFGRDNIDLLIRSFAEISAAWPHMHLVLGGFCTDNDRRQIEDLIASLNIGSQVQLLRFITRDQIIGYISHAKILVMVRASDLESQASYPSKLTEFLASGKPVVTVEVGEISRYLKDGVTAFLVEPGNVAAMTYKLGYVLDNYESAKVIGQKGKSLTDAIFNYNFQAKRIIGFIDSLSKEPKGLPVE